MLHDLRYGIRTLIKSPGFAVVAMLTLALGIGANTAVFSLARAIFLAPLPFADEERLLVIAEQRDSSGAASLPVSGHEYVAWNQQNRSFDRIALFHREGLTLTGAGDPASIDVSRVSPDIFPLLGVRPALGRAFDAQDASAGADRTVVLSDALWRRRFHANAAIVGQGVALDGDLYTVVGVMPPLPATLAPDAWLPLDVTAEARAVGRHNLSAIGRLASGVSRDQALADLEQISGRLARALPDDNTGHHPKLTSLRESLVGDVRAAWQLLLLAVGFVLLIACANVANLLLTRGAQRQKEIAVRLALGAGRARVIRIVGDVRHNELSAPVSPHIYLSHSQEPWNSVSFVVRTTGAPGTVAAAVRDRVRAMDPALPVSVRALDDVVDASVGRPRFYAVLIGLFGTVALGLAIVGIAGVVGFAVVQRTREIGVRMALGAQRGEILKLVVRQGMQPIAIGVCAGVAGGFVLTRFIRTLLFRVAPTDPLSLAVAVALMTVVALMACWVPARRAAALDPVAALRGE